MPYTGGPLNELNGKMGISAPHRSVPVMKLIKTHRPKSKQALVELIGYHFTNNCKCGIKSQGTVEDFGKNLYEAQPQYWGEYRYSLRDCIQWEFDLFVVQSLKGSLMEKKASQLLSRKCPGYSIEEAEGYLDEELRIDLLVKFENQVKCGIQVKPDTFNKMRSEVISFNKIANKKLGKPVLYLFYDRNKNFLNLDTMINTIEADCPCCPGG